MSYKQMTGNIISATKVEPDGAFITSAASGVWNLQEQYDYVRGGNWPNAANPAPTGIFAITYGTDGEVKNGIDTISITSAGNASDFGDLSVGSRQGLGSVSSNTRGVFAGGEVSNSASNHIDYVTISSAGNASDFGDLAANARFLSGAGSQTRGIFTMGNTSFDYITIANTGNSTDFGNASRNQANNSSASSSTRSVHMGGAGPTNAIDYLTIASTGDATDFGDLTATREKNANGAVCSDTRAITSGAESGAQASTIEYLTIASTGNGTSFGDLVGASNNGSSCSSKLRGLLHIGYNGSIAGDTVSFITIASTGDAADYGDLTVAHYKGAGLSNNHGGLA